MRLQQPTRPRRVPFERAFNFRDLGGYAIEGGRTVRWGLVYRADGIHRIEGADLARVASLGIRTVLDVRSRGEANGDEQGAVPHGLFDAVDVLAGRYLALLEQGATSITNALETMSDAERLPLVFHCSAGKDRTGVLAAVLLSVVGVSDDDIAADDALSRAAMREMADWARVDRPESFEAPAVQPPAFLDAPELAMRRFLALARTTYGSLTRYVVAAGLGPERVDALRAALLVA